MTIVHGQLAPEDVARMQACVMRVDAAARAPEAYSASEHEQIIMANMRALADFIQRYDVEVTRDWEICKYTGKIWYT